AAGRLDLPLHAVRLRPRARRPRVRAVLPVRHRLDARRRHPLPGGPVGARSLRPRPPFPFAIASMLVVGIGFGGLQSLNAAVIVRATEPAYFGRVFSISMLAFAGVSLVRLAVGAFAGSLGERRAVASLACVVAAIAATLAALLR